MDIQKFLDEMKEGEHLTIPGRGGWKTTLTKTAGGFDTTITNPTEDGRKKFYEVSTVGNPYGAPIIIQEPSLGIGLRECGVEIDGVVVGGVVTVDGKVTDRYSWSNLVFVKKSDMMISPSGELFVGGESKGFLAVLLQPDKNRMKGFVGYFTPTKPVAVRFVELEDAALLLVK